VDGSVRLQVATLVAAIFVVIVGIINLFAVDRLEQQVIRVAKEVEALQGMGGGGPAVARVSQSGPATPGSGTGYTAMGWGGATAEIKHVEGAEPGAPLTLSQKPKPQGGAYINRRSEPPGSLNYYTTNEGEASQATKMALGRLMQVDPDNPPDVIPELATSWEVSDDKLSYTFHLRKGVQFADGRDFTSADVLFSFAVMRDPQVKADHMRPGFEDVISVEAPDPYTVVFTYREPYWKALYKIGTELYVLNSGWYAEQIPRMAAELEIEPFATEPGKPGFGEVFNKMRGIGPGTGPYYFPHENYDPTVGADLIQNPFYFGIQIFPSWWNFAEYKRIYISDRVAAFEEFRREKFDITTVDFQPWDDEYSSDPTITEISDYYEYDHTGLAFSGIWWNAREAPFDDPKVRYALAHLVDRQWIVDEIERGRGQIAVCPTKPIYDGYNSELTPIPFDPAKARALLEEAGWTDTDGDGVLDKDGERFEFEIKIGSARRFYTQVTAQMADAAQKAGIRMSVRQLEWATFIEDFYERRFDGVILYNSFPDPWVDPYDDFHSSQDIPRGPNHPGWHNERADQLLEEMRVEFDDAKRDAKFREFCSIFQAEQPMTLLVHGIVGVLISDRIEDVKVRKGGMQAHEFWIKPENVLER